MALIECSKCGKKISDTTDICIHCGAAIGVIEEVKIEEQHTEEKIKEEKITQKKNYKQFSDSLKTKYEKEFLDSNKSAMKYRRKGLELKKVVSLGETSMLFGAIIIIGFRYLLNNFFDGDIYNEDYMLIAAVASVGLIAFGVLMMICAIVAKIVYNRTLKSYLYLKTFSNWLDNKYDIEYEPDFFSEKERAIYNKINLDIMKL